MFGTPLFNPFSSYRCRFAHCLSSCHLVALLLAIRDRLLAQRDSERLWLRPSDWSSLKVIWHIDHTMRISSRAYSVEGRAGLHLWLADLDGGSSQVPLFRAQSPSSPRLRKAARYSLEGRP